VIIEDDELDSTDDKVGAENIIALTMILIVLDKI
jgi:hypothetical protein